MDRVNNFDTITQIYCFSFKTKRKKGKKKALDESNALYKLLFWDV
jgi:hypothetical protein